MNRIKNCIQKTTLLFIVSLMFTLTSRSQSNNWVVNSSAVVFEIKNAKALVTGNFTGLTASITFNPLALSTSKIEAKIAVKTIKTGIEMRDNHLKKSEYFNAEKFPEISIVTNKISKIGDNQFVAKCTLTMKGKSKEVDLPFTYSEKDNKASFIGTLKINRLDFGVGSSSVIMAKDLIVKITVYTSRK